MKMLSRLIDCLPSAILVLNQDGVIVDANQQFVHLFEATTKDILGRQGNTLLPYLDFTACKTQFVKAGDSSLPVSDVPPQVLTGVTHEGLNIKLSLRFSFYEQDGQSYLLASASPVNADSSMLELFDMTQTVANIGSWKLDLIAQTCTWSKMVYQIHELDPSVEVRLEDGINFYAPEHRAIIEKCVQTCIENQEPWDVELKIVTTSGKHKWVNAIGSAVVVDGEVVGIGGTFQDIHQRKLLQIEREQFVQKLSHTEEIANIGHWEWRMTPEAMDWSEGMYQIFGAEANSPVPTIAEHRSYIYSGDKKDVYATVENAVKHAQSYSIEFRIVIEGKIKFLRIDARPLLSDNGVLIGFFGIAQDVSKMRESKLQYLDQSSRLTLAMKAANAGVWEWDIKTDKLIWDSQMLRLYNIEAEDFIDAYSSWEAGLHPEDKEIQTQLIQQSVADSSQFDTAFRVIWRNGEIRHIRALADVIHDGEGKPVRMIGVNWDITEESEQKLALQTSNERHELMLKGTSVGVWDWPDVNSPVEYWSEKFYELLGYQNDEIEASLASFQKLLHPDDAAATFAAMDLHFTKDDPFNLNYRLKTKSGAYRWFKGAGQVAKGLDGKPYRMVGTVQDIHEQILAEKNLLRINGELLQISYRTSHDLKAPLTTTKRLAHFIVQDLDSGDVAEARANVLKIGKQMEKLEELVSGILSLAKADLTTEPPAKVDFNALATEIDAGLEYERTNAKCDISWNINVNEGFNGEKARFIQIIENLVSNGIKYRNPNTSSMFVRASIADNDKSLLIEVEDNGLGIPQNYQTEIYDMFKRFHPDVKEGSGLGLAIVKKHIDFLNGSIQVQSNPNGTKFTIEIPKH